MERNDGSAVKAAVPAVPHKYLSAIVWTLRILVGGTFVVSGLAKSIDIWGVSFKIEEYFTAWGIDIPYALDVVAAMLLSVAEFLLGAMLLLGCYRRGSSYLLLAIMCFMLPLSLYIYLAYPVADCGCFGDFLIISNGATFLKNIFLTAALVVLAIYNRKVQGLYGPYWQWMVGLCCFVYCVAIALWGYNLQPLVDFRSFPVGRQLVADTDTDTGDVQFEFVYERNGTRQTFSQDSLPDSSWTFVDRKMISGAIDNTTDLAIYDDGDDVTDEALSPDSYQMIISMPDVERAGITYTYKINELNNIMDSIGGSLVEIAAIPSDSVDHWKDLSMADYPIYTAEPTTLKELVRGVMGAVLLKDGRIVWKRTLSSIDLDNTRQILASGRPLDDLAIDGRHTLTSWTLVLLSILAALFMANRFVGFLKALKKITPIKKK
ncbi:MAG: DoxX family protein [Bacteroides sp.]|nr:DoxX family protein [Bacteroides sp.]MCM1413441.1 DoxX family protein [Bacteroides sp.]MCM1471348.1 DoxX family protein [Bacteroides sp.]